MRIVGLKGHIGTGKDTAAAGLIERGWIRIAFADPIKRLATGLGWNGTKDPDGRRFLQELGDATKDALGPDIWVDLAEARIDAHATAPGIVVTDVRYPAEAAMLRRHGALIVEIRRAGHHGDTHSSETDQRLVVPDEILENTGDAAELQEALRRLVL